MEKQEAQRVAAQLTRAQLFEFAQIRDDDMGFMARGDQAALSRIGLATPPRDTMGHYRLTPLGLAVRNHLTTNKGEAK